MPVAVRLRYVEDVYGKNAGAEQRDYYRQHTAATAVILFPIWLGTMFQQLYNTVDT